MCILKWAKRAKAEIEPMPPGMIGLGCEYKRKQCVNVSKHTPGIQAGSAEYPGTHAFQPEM